MAARAKLTTQPYHAVGDPDLVEDFLVVHEQIAESKFARIFAATDLRNSEPRALKLPKAATALDRRQIATEYEALSAAQHRGIVAAHGIVHVDGTPGLVLDRVEGFSISHGVRKSGPMSVAGAAGVVQQLSRALLEVHRTGWLHADVKPSNVMIEPSGRVVLVDFGVARRSTDYTPAAFSGTPTYASPEQVRGEPLDERSDIYSLGATLYFMLTGRPPHIEDDLLTRMREGTLDDPMRLSEATGLPFPADLENTIATMLRADRDERPRSMRMVEALMEALTPTTLGFESTSSFVESVQEAPTLSVLEDEPTVLVVDDPTPVLTAETTSSAPRSSRWAALPGVLAYQPQDNTLVIQRENHPTAMRPIDVQIRGLALERPAIVHLLTDDDRLVTVSPDGETTDRALGIELDSIAAGEGLLAGRSVEGKLMLSRDGGETWWLELASGVDAFAVSPNGNFVAALIGTEVVIYEVYAKSAGESARGHHPNAASVAVSDAGRAVALSEDGRGVALSDETKGRFELETPAAAATLVAGTLLVVEERPSGLHLCEVDLELI